MKTTANWLVTTGALVLAAIAVPAQANVIGVAINPTTGATVGSTNSDGSINFYANLNGTGTYGVGSTNNGLVADTCSLPGTTSTACGGGVLDMWLRFSPVALGANLLTLQFTDLDLYGVNDPYYFFESLSVSSGPSTSSLTSQSYQVVSANDDNQTLRVALNVASTTSNQYFARLRFVTSFLNAPSGTYTNTPERVRATIASVPEPAMLSMLGAGLLLVGFASRRRAQASK